MYQHLLICTDGSEVAQKGVDHGLKLAQSLKAKVTLITATESFPLDMGAAGNAWAPPQSAFDDFDAAQKSFAGETLASAKSQAEKLGVTAEIFHVTNTRPAEAILETAASKSCDLIVMASHGRRGIKKLLLGSQAQEVVTESTIPVLVVR